LEEYQGFEDVFKYTDVFRERDDSKTVNPFTDIAEQNLYLIDTGETRTLKHNHHMHQILMIILMR